MKKFAFIAALALNHCAFGQIVQDSFIKNSLRDVANNSIRGMKELKKVDLMQHDSFTQKTWIFKEIKDLALLGAEQKRNMETYIQYATKELNAGKKLKQQHKPVGEHFKDSNYWSDKAGEEIEGFNATLDKIKAQGDLLNLADSVTIIKRIVVAKFFFTLSDDTLSAQKYKITFSKNYAQGYAIKQDD